MENTKKESFLRRKNIEISARRYGIDALGAMAQGLFASLLIGTILNTLGTQLGIQALVDVGAHASSMSGAAMAVAIGFALQAPPLVLFSLVTVGKAANELGGAGGPLSVLIIAIIAERRCHHHVGDQPAALPYGNHCLCGRGHRSYPAHLLRGDLCRSGTHGPRGRRRRGRLLCPDGRFCLHVL